VEHGLGKKGDSDGEVGGRGPIRGRPRNTKGGTKAMFYSVRGLRKRTEKRGTEGATGTGRKYGVVPGRQLHNLEKWTG